MRMVAAALPQTAATEAALAVARRFCSPALLNHSIRSWYWAVGFATRLSVEVGDPELLAVSALLHDIGLVPEFDNVRLPFETAGGQVAWVLSAGAGWVPGRRDRAVEVIERHMQPEVEASVDPEGHLLEIATSLDISGRRDGVLPAGYVAEVLAEYPRLTLAAEFGACLQEQAARKPGSQAARLVSAGLTDRLAANPLER